MRPLRTTSCSFTSTEGNKLGKEYTKRSVGFFLCVCVFSTHLKVKNDKRIH